MKRALLVGLCLLVAGCATTHPSGKTSMATRSVADQIKASLPPLPQEYEWTVFQGTAIPTPKQWHAHRNIEDHSLSVSLERPGWGGSFKTGVTIKSYRYLGSFRDGDVIDTDTYGGTPYSGADYVIKGVRATKGVRMLSEPTATFRNGTHFYNMSYLIQSPGEKAIRVTHLLIEDDQAYMVRSIRFQAPVSTWDKHWANEGRFIFSLITAVSVSPGS